MNMITHQTVCPYRNTLFLTIAFQRFFIILSVFIIKKYVGSVISTLGYMMRILYRYDSCYPWHVFVLSYRTCYVNYK